MDDQDFDLNDLLTINTDYNLLKKVLEYLLSRDKNMANRLSKLESNFGLLKDETAK